MTGERGAGLTALFRDHLRKCGISGGEEVVVFTDTQFPYPEYEAAASAAAQDLGARPLTLTASSEDALASRLMLQAWTGADMVIGVSTLPWLRFPINAEAMTLNEAALLAGTRTLLVAEPPTSLRRMFPDDAVVARTYAGADRLKQAATMRITDSHGTDLSMFKGERKAHAQCGLPDRPGRWDHWPSGLVASVPHEDSANGSFVALPGDVMFRRYITSPVRLTLEDGVITKIEGGFEADLLQQYLEGARDSKAFRLSHVGWGTEHRADWNHISSGRLPTAPCPDQEGKYGTVTLAIGHNASQSSDDYCGLDGVNRTAAHIDLSCRRKSFWLDESQIIEDESFCLDELA